MLNLGSKTFFAGAGLTGLVAIIYSLASSDYAGAVLLLVATAALTVLGVGALTSTGSAERFAFSQQTQARADRPTIAPFGAALGAGVVALGAALGTPAVVAGLIVAAVAGLAWFSASWRGHPSHVSSLIGRVSDRFTLPFGVPVAALALVVIIGIAISRVFLAVSKNTATAVSVVVALVIFAAGFVWAAKPNSKTLVRLLLAGAVVSTVAMFVAGQVAGEREFHKPGSEHGAEHGSDDGAGHGDSHSSEDAETATE